MQEGIRFQYLKPYGQRYGRLYMSDKIVAILANEWSLMEFGQIYETTRWEGGKFAYAKIRSYFVSKYFYCSFEERYKFTCNDLVGVK